jgi:hypothetical protein
LGKGLLGLAIPLAIGVAQWRPTGYIAQTFHDFLVLCAGILGLGFLVSLGQLSRSFDEAQRHVVHLLEPAQSEFFRLAGGGVPIVQAVKLLRIASALLIVLVVSGTVAWAVFARWPGVR